MLHHPLHIYRASAGSGKTFTLAVNYIRLLIEHPDAYRHILAVTFTNKATAEMKQRIIGKLYGIAHHLDDAEPYFKEIQEKTRMEESLIRQRAETALSLLIHDYSHFRVETIDSFFQSILRGLARELHLGMGMTIELDTKRVISDTVDILLRELSADDPTLLWIVRYIGDEMKEGKHWNITDKVKQFAKNIHNDNYQRHADKLRQQLEKQDTVNALRDQLIASRNAAISPIANQVKSFFELLEAHNLTPEDFSYGKSGVCGYYLKLRDGNYNNPLSGRALTASQDPKAWAAGKSPRKKEIDQLAASHLIPHILQTEQARSQGIYTINTCNLVLSHLYQLQLINAIHDRMQQLNRDENRFLLADTCGMLSQMQSGDSSFVFEKLGYYIHHIMIDEFQDTSRMQWDNFLPLLREGLSQGKDSMLVGDVKQAIYRWRGSDWRILNEEVNDTLRLYTPGDAHKLDINRRSQPEIVKFNNKLFKNCNSIFEQELGNDYAQPLLRAYADVEQEYKEGDGGYVRIVNIDHAKEESADEAMCREVLRTIEELHTAGIRDNEIALLLRTNTQIQLLVDYFAQTNPSIHLFSSDAYRLDSSIAAGMLTDAMRWIADPAQQLALARLAINYHQRILGDDTTFSDILAAKADGYGLPEMLIHQADRLCLMPLYELAEELYRILQLQCIDDENDYLLAFFDRLLAFCSTNNDIKAFIKHWDDDMGATSIPAGEKTHGIEAMTIHKSKGLEFHTVIIPYCEWELNKHSGILWAEQDEAPFNLLDVIPIPYSEIMMESRYATEYREEYLQQLVDSYNLLYVACTRPKNNLIILKSASKCSIAKGKKMNNVAQLITQALQSSDSDTIEYGVLDTSHKGSVATTNRLEAPPAPTAVTMHSEALRNKFRQSNLSMRYIHRGENEEQSAYIDQGTLLHALFSMIRTSDDVDRAIAQMIRDGLIANADERHKIENIVRRALTHPKAAEWFSGRYELFNECSIIYQKDDGTIGTMRPDRVMNDGHAFTVVDFKFARPCGEHAEQVSRYVTQIRTMGHQQVEGYLWYVYENKIVPV